MAAVRRANRPVQLVVGLPLLLAAGAAVSGWAYERGSRHFGDQERVGRFTRPEAIRRAVGLVSLVSGAPAGAVEAFSVIGCQPHARGDTHTGQQSPLFAILDQPLDRFLKRSPHRDVMAALREQDRAHGRHGAVAEDRDAFGHGADSNRRGTRR